MASNQDIHECERCGALYTARNGRVEYHIGLCGGCGRKLDVAYASDWDVKRMIGAVSAEGCDRLYCHTQPS